MTRNRQRTEQHLIDAVGTILVRDGMAALSASAIAAEAGVDRALIYKYFKTLDRLFERHVTGPPILVSFFLLMNLKKSS